MEKRIFENFAEIKIQEDEQEIIINKMDIFPQRVLITGKDISKMLNWNNKWRKIKKAYETFC